MTTVVVPAVLRPVVCVIDHLCRSEAVADAARAGHYTHAGVTLDLGRRPDWLHGGLPHDEEWRIEFVKLYEGLDLAHAYVATGDRDHLAAWEDLVESFCEQVPVGHDSSDVSARRIQNWIYAWQRAEQGHPGTELRPGLAERLVARLRADVDHLRANLTAERNHRTLELYALLVAALALPDDGRAEADAESAVALLADNARTDLLDDGMQRELSTDYHCIVLRSLLGTVANARAAGLVLPDGFVERVGLACDVALHVQRPDGRTPSLSDGDVGDFRDVLALGAQLLDRPDLAWVATTGAAGAPPASTAATFAVGGLVVQRSGWGDGARAYGDEWFATFDVGPLGDGGHGHYDHLSVELMADGHLLAVDPGRYTYADTPWRRAFKGTAAHNTVCVDGLDQTPYRRGKPKGPTSTASLVSRRSHGDVDAAVGRAVSPCYDAVHTRRLALVRDHGWIVHDQLRAPSTHEYALRWHLPAEALGAVTLRRHPHGAVVRTPHADYLVSGASSVKLERGWVSEEYGVKVPAPVLVARVTGADVDLLTIVVPGRGVRIDTAIAGPSGCFVTVQSPARAALLWPASAAFPVWGDEPRPADDEPVLGEPAW